MSVTLGLAQSGYPADGEVLAQMEAFASDAAAQGVQLLAFPEDLMCPRPMGAQALRELSQPLDGPFMQGVSAIAARHGLWIVGTMDEATKEGVPHNTAFVVADDGTLRATYRKCHLYDAHGILESDRISAGSSLFAPIQTPFGTLGLGICYDLRFPELARAAALGGAELLLYPACWHDGPQKADHWETLLRARAIENELFVAGICHAGRRYVERSLVIDPLGRIVSEPQTGEALLVAQIDIGNVATARDRMPVLEHRRPELYL